MKNKARIKIARFFKHSTSKCRCYKTVDDVKNVPLTEEFERCVVCGALTCVPISTPIDLRDNYVIGLGQICVECAKKQREATIRDNTLTNVQIMLSVEQSRKESKK